MLKGLAGPVQPQQLDWLDSRAWPTTGSAVASAWAALTTPGRSPPRPVSPATGLYAWDRISLLRPPPLWKFPRIPARAKLGVSLLLANPLPRGEAMNTSHERSRPTHDMTTHHHVLLDIEGTTCRGELRGRHALPLRPELAFSPFLQAHGQEADLHTVAQRSQTPAWHSAHHEAKKPQN